MLYVSYKTANINGKTGQFTIVALKWQISLW